MSRAEIFALSDNAVNAAADRIIGIGRRLWENPETGFREHAAFELLTGELRALGFDVRGPFALTGFRADLDTGRPGPVVAVMGEYDALIIPEHPEAVRGCVHSCGHHTSAAGLIGTAIGLRDAAASGELCGKIAFIGTPAEEGVELEYRQELIRAGKIASVSGKAQLIREGVLDDVDIAFMHHLSTGYGYFDHNGSVCKKIIFKGRSCHAANPQFGVNALNGMNLALHALGLLRESYGASDRIRFHGIVADGGTSVNVIPDRAVLDYFLRADTVESLLDLNRRFDNAVRHAGMAAECEVEIRTVPYTMPLYDDPVLGAELEKVVRELLGETVKYDANTLFRATCTDMGDVATIIPAVHGYVPGAAGTFHGTDFRVENWHDACVMPALINARLAIDLLIDDAAVGKRIAARKAQLMTKAEYLKVLDSLTDFTSTQDVR